MGTSYLIVVLVGVGVASTALRVRLLPDWSGVAGRLSEVVLGVSLLVIAAELLGSFGLLTRLGLLLATLVLGVGGVLDRGRRRSLTANAGQEAVFPQPRWAAPAAVTVAAVAVAHWSSGIHYSLAYGIYRQDSTWYHLPVAAGFFQSGDTWALHFTDPMALAAWFYPMNSELLHAVGMLAMGTDFLSVFLNVAWMVLALLAAWCAGAPFGVGLPAVAGAAVVLDAEMMQAQAGNAPADVAAVFFLTAAVAILLNAHKRKKGLLSPGPVAVAGLAAGLALGTKVTMLVPVAVLTVALVALLPKRSRAAPVAAWGAGLLATGGYWYLRNLLHAGNPLPWISLGPLPSPAQLPLYPRPAHSVADYATDPSVWSHQFVPALHSALGDLWPLVLGLAAAGLLLALARGSLLIRVLAVAGLAAVVAYLFIPVSASGPPGHPSGFESNLRYLAPTLVLGLILLALQFPKRASLLAAALLAVFLLNTLTSHDWSPSQAVTAAVLVLVLVLLPAALSTAPLREVPRLQRVGVVSLVLLLTVVIGYRAQRDYLRTRYLPSLAPAADSPGFRDTPPWRLVQSWARSVQGARIGVVGPPAAFGQYIFYGSDLSNRVDYLGETSAHGGYRPISNCAAWRRAIDRRRDDYLVVTPATAIGPGPVPQETLWVHGDPHSHEIVDARPAAVFRIDGRLDPAGCKAEHLPPVLRVPGGGFGLRPTGRGLRAEALEGQN